MAHYGKRTKKSSYTQTLHLKPFAAGFSRKNWKGNLLTESRLCFENRLAELSLTNLGSRSQFSAGGTSGSCPVRDAGLQNGSTAEEGDTVTWPAAISARALPSPSLPRHGGLSGCFGPIPRSVPAQGSARRNTQLDSSGCQSHLTLAAKVTCLLFHASKTWKGDMTSGKTVPQAKEQENSCDLRTRLSIQFLPCSMSCPSNEMKGTQGRQRNLNFVTTTSQRY